MKHKLRQGAAILYTTHCCDLCIAKQYSEEDLSKVLLSLSQIVPKHPALSQEYKVLYCLSYFLKTCIKVRYKKLTTIYMCIILCC